MRFLNLGEKSERKQGEKKKKDEGNGVKGRRVGLFLPL
jgi:hypothetical protein